MKVFVRFVAAVVAVVLAAGIGLLVQRSNDDSESTASSDSSGATLPGGPSASDPAVVQLPQIVGPAAGTDVAPYMAARRTALAAAARQDAPRLALPRDMPEAGPRRVQAAGSLGSLVAG